MASSSSRFPLILILLLLIEAATSCGPNCCGPILPVETPTCSVFSRELGYELRNYPAGQSYVELLMYNTTYEVASTSGFIRLAAYVKGENYGGLQMPTTLPFTVRPFSDIGGYIVGLYLSPSVKDPPAPVDKMMRVTQTTQSIRAVLPFSGPVVNETSYLHYTRELLRYLQRDQLAHAALTYARYTFPFQRAVPREEGLPVPELYLSVEEVHVPIAFN